MENIPNEPQVRRLKTLKRKTISTNPILIEEIKLENVVGVTVTTNTSLARSSSGKKANFPLNGLMKCPVRSAGLHCWLRDSSAGGGRTASPHQQRQEAGDLPGLGS